jgi:hypothetical protein
MQVKRFRLPGRVFFLKRDSKPYGKRVSAEKFDSPFSTPRPYRNLSKKHRRVDWHLAADAFNLTLTAGTEKVKANAVFIGFDQLSEARP